MKQIKNKILSSKTCVTETARQTEEFAEKLGKTLKPGAILLLIGDLGSGKTSFVRGLAKGLKVSSKTNIHSPTFTLINEYPGKIPLIHVDLYRLDSIAEIENLGLEDYFRQEAIIAIEWADRAMVSSQNSRLAANSKNLEFWPKESIRIEFERVSEKKRKISIKPPIL